MHHHVGDAAYQMKQFPVFMGKRKRDAVKLQHIVRYYCTKQKVNIIFNHLKVTEKKPAGYCDTYRMTLVKDEAKAKGC